MEELFVETHCLGILRIDIVEWEIWLSLLLLLCADVTAQWF